MHSENEHRCFIVTELLLGCEHPGGIQSAVCWGPKCFLLTVEGLMAAWCARCPELVSWLSLLAGKLCAVGLAVAAGTASPTTPKKVELCLES